MKETEVFVRMKKEHKTSRSKTYCAYCELDLSGFPKEKILEIFALHRKCTKILQEEIMAAFNCSCGNQALEYKSGVGKTGKKWQGWKCAPCNIMYGMNGIPWGDKPKAPNGISAPTMAPTTNRIEQLLEAILKELKKMNGNKESLIEEPQEEGSPF